jgi:hypothetical protein
MAAVAVFGEEVLARAIVDLLVWPAAVPGIIEASVFQADWLTERARALYLLHLSTHAPDRVYLNQARRLASRVLVVQAQQLRAGDDREDRVFLRVGQVFTAQSNHLTVLAHQAQTDRRRALAQELRRSCGVVEALRRRVLAVLDDPEG